MSAKGSSSHFSLCSSRISISSMKDAPIGPVFLLLKCCSASFNLWNSFSRLPNGHINFEKFWQLAKQVTEFMTWKQVTCPFDKHSKVIHYLQTGTILSENGRKKKFNHLLLCMNFNTFSLFDRYCAVFFRVWTAWSTWKGTIQSAKVSCLFAVYLTVFSSFFFNLNFNYFL